MRRGHIKLDGEWYMLWTDEDGRISQGNTARITGPWAAQMSQGPREYHDLTEESVHVWHDVLQGIGFFKSTEENTLRRAWADTRSGDVVLGPQAHGSVGYTLAYLPEPGRPVVGGAQLGQGYGTVGAKAGGVLAATADIESVQVLVRRVPTADYWDSEPVSVELASGSVSLAAEIDMLKDLPRAGEWRWVTARAASYERFGAGDVTLTLTNASGELLEWAANYEGSLMPYYRMREWDDVDGTPVGFMEFKGADRQRRLYVGVNHKVMYWGRAGEKWNVARRFPADVKQMAVFGASTGAAAQLFVALSASQGIWTFTGGSVYGVWVEQSAMGQALAVHDGMLWRAQGAEVCGSRTGFGGSYGNKAPVGYGGMPVLDMVSQDGQLFVRTEEGIYAVTYPDEYPTTGTPIATRVVNLELDRAPHDAPMLVPYGAGVLFPTSYDVQRYEAGLITNISAGRGQALTEEDALQYWALAPTSRGVFAAVQGPGHGYSGLMLYQEPADGPAGWHYLYRNPMPREETQAIYLTLDDFDSDVARLWFGAGAGVQYVRLPQWTRRRYLWSGADYERSGVVEYPAFDANKAALVKDWRRVNVRAVNAAATAPITLFWTLADEGIEYFRPGAGYPMATVGTWATLGQVTESGITQFTFPADSYGYKVLVRAELETQDPGYTPRVEAVELWYQDIVPPLRAFRVVLALQRGAGMLDGGPMMRTVAEQWSALCDLADEPEGFEFEDELGEAYTVRLTQLMRTSYRFGERTDDALEPEYLAYVEMLRID